MFCNRGRTHFFNRVEVLKVFLQSVMQVVNLMPSCFFTDDRIFLKSVRSLVLHYKKETV